MNQINNWNEGCIKCKETRVYVYIYFLLAREKENYMKKKKEFSFSLFGDDGN